MLALQYSHSQDNIILSLLVVITFRAEGPSGLFEMLSGVTGSEKAGHGVSCWNFLVL